MGGEISAHLPAVRCKGQDWTGSLCSMAFSRCGLWSVSPLRNWTPASCRWSPPWLCRRRKDSRLFPWKWRAQVHIKHILYIMYIMHIVCILFCFRYILHKDQPVYGFWLNLVLFHDPSWNFYLAAASVAKVHPQDWSWCRQAAGLQSPHISRLFCIFCIFVIFDIFQCHVFRLKKDGVTSKEVPLIGAGFQAFENY